MGILQKWWDINTDILHAVTGVPTASQKRDQASMVSNQVKAYKQQTELSNQVVMQAKQQQNTDRRRMSEKIVASMRRMRSSPSTFGQEQQQSGDLATTLGG